MQSLLKATNGQSSVDVLWKGCSGLLRATLGLDVLWKRYPGDVLMSKALKI